MSIGSINQASNSSSTADGEEEESNEGSDSEEEANDMTIKLHKYVQAFIKKQLRDPTIQTGGFGVRKGKALKKKQGAMAMEVMAKMHVVMPVIEGMMLRPHFHNLLMNYTI